MSGQGQWRMPHTQIHEVAKLLALELCDDAHRWAYGPNKTHNAGELYRGATIVRDDGLELWVEQNQGNRRSQQYEVSQLMQCDAWQSRANGVVDPREYTGQGGYERMPSMNVAATKTPVRIACEVKRKIMPDAERLHAAGIARREQWDGSADKRDANAIAMGINPTSGRHHDSPSRTYHAGDTRAEVTAHSDDIDLAITGLTATQALAVLQALGVVVESWERGWTIRGKRHGYVVVTVQGATASEAWRKAAADMKQQGRSRDRSQYTIEREEA